jgi:hypothetical protein
MEGDIGLQVAVIASFTSLLFASAGYYIWNHCKSKPTMKESPSQTDLTTLDDPEEI